MQDEIKTAGVIGLVGAAVGAGVALGLGLRLFSGVAMVGLGTLTLILVEGRTLPAAWTAGLAVVAVAGLAAFVASQRRAVTPMLPLDLFRSSRLNAALTATFAMTFATYGLLLVNSFAFQQQRGASTLFTASIQACWNSAPPADGGTMNEYRWTSRQTL